jgi:FMN-dependent NADH-azoreductase
MKNILQINTSLFSEQGESSRLTQAFIDAWMHSYPEDRVVVRDLAKNPVPHLTAGRFRAFLTPEGERTSEQIDAVNCSDTLIDELRAADVLVLGLPMYNFGIPSTLKAYFDHVARAGVTFHYAQDGPVGLLRGKKAYVLATRGGLYRGTPLDTQSEYLKNFLKFLGIVDIEFIYAEGLARGEEQAHAELIRARSEINRLVARKPVLGSINRREQSA